MKGGVDEGPGGQVCKCRAGAGLPAACGLPMKWDNVDRGDHWVLRKHCLWALPVCLVCCLCQAVRGWFMFVCMFVE